MKKINSLISKIFVSVVATTLMTAGVIFITPKTTDVYAAGGTNYTLTAKGSKTSWSEAPAELKSGDSITITFDDSDYYGYAKIYVDSKSDPAEQFTGYTGTISYTATKDYTVELSPNQNVGYNIYLTTKVSGYTITYDANDATSGDVPTDSTSYAEGASVTVLGNTGSLDRDGYIFSGWNTEYDGFGDDYAVGSIYTMGSSNITLYAKWDPAFTILYDTNGGTGTAPTDTNKYRDQEQATLASTDGLTKSGHHIVGWGYSENATYGECISSPYTVCEGDAWDGVITLYAVWEPDSYCPTHHSQMRYILTGTNGACHQYFCEQCGSAYGTSEVHDTDGEYNSCSKCGCHSLTYVLDGGTNGSNLSYYFSDETYTLYDATKNGYTFGGWYLDDNFKDKITEITAGFYFADLTLYAKWTPISYNITYNLEGGTNNSNNPATYNIETAIIILADPTKNGCAFVGWFSDDTFSTQVMAIAQGSTGDRTLYAKWVNYIYTYSEISSSWDKSVETSYKQGDKIIFNDIYTGFSLFSYAINVNGLDTISVSGGSSREYTVANNGATIELCTSPKVVVKIIDVPSYTITYNLNNGTNDSNNPATYTQYTETITLANPTRVGYKFLGWFDNSGFTGSAITQIAQGSTGNKEFYAKWLKVITAEPTSTNNYTVSVDSSLTNITYQWYKYVASSIDVKDSTEIQLNTGTYNQANNTYTSNFLLGVAWVVSFKPKAGVDVDMEKIWLQYTYNGSTYIVQGKKSYSKENPGVGISNINGNETYTISNVKVVKYNPEAISGETNNVLGCETPENTSYYCVISDNSGIIATTEEITSKAITFNGGSESKGSAPDTMYQLEKRTITLPANTFTRDGHKFLKWNTQSDGSGTDYVVGATYTVGSSDVTLYAKWLKIIATEPTKDNDYTVVVDESITNATYQWQKEVVEITEATIDSSKVVTGTYDAENKTVTSVSNAILLGCSSLITLRFTSDDEIKLTDTVKKYDEYYYCDPVFIRGGFGYTIEGNSEFTISNIQYYSSTIEDLSGEDEDTIKNATENVRYRCKVTSQSNADSYSDYIKPNAVSFEGGEDATGTAPNTMYQLEKRTITLPANPFTRTGYKFLKWNTESDGSGTDYAVGATYTVGSSDATLYAIWEDLAYSETIKISISELGYNTQKSDISISIVDGDEIVQIDSAQYGLYTKNGNNKTAVTSVTTPNTYYVVFAFSLLDGRYFKTIDLGFMGIVYLGDIQINGDTYGTYIWKITACSSYDNLKEFSCVDNCESYKKDKLYIEARFILAGNSLTYDDSVTDSSVSNMPTDESLYLENAPVTISTKIPVREGYKFLGWSLTQDGEVITTSTVEMIENGRTLYAIWKNKQAQTVVITNDISKIFDNTKVSAPTYTRLGDGVVTVEYKLKNEDDSKYSTNAPINAGEYTVRVSVSEGTDYLAGTQTADFKISKIVISEFELDDLEYTGSSISVVQKIYEITGSNVDISGSSNGTTVGTYTATISLLDTNYIWDNETSNYDLQWKIIPKEVELIWCEDDFTYSGENQISKLTVKYLDVKNKNVVLTFNGPFTVVGDYPITAVISDQNYTASNTTKTYHMKQAQNEITTLVQNDVYCGESINPTVASKFGKATLTYSKSETSGYTNNVPNSVGKWYVKAYIKGTDNYYFVEEIYSFKILAKEISVTAGSGVENKVKGELIAGQTNANTQIVVKKVDLKKDYKTINKNLQNISKKSEILATYDISLESNGVKVEPIEGSKYRITISLDEKMLNKNGYAIIHIDENNNVERYVGLLNDDKNKIIFETTHFSRWGIIADKVESKLWIWVLVGVCLFEILVMILIIIFCLKKNVKFMVNGQEFYSMKLKYKEDFILPKKLCDYRWYTDKQKTKLYTKEKIGLFDLTLYGDEISKRKRKN